MTRPVPRALLLDLAGVLSFFDKEGRLRRMAAAADLPEEEVTARIYGSGLVADADAGRLTADEMRTQLQGRLDLPAIVAAYADPGVRLHLLSNPHNPTGVVHTADELRTLAEAAAARLDHSDLTAILSLLGIPEEVWIG